MVTQEQVNKYLEHQFSMGCFDLLAADNFTDVVRLNKDSVSVVISKKFGLSVDESEKFVKPWLSTQIICYNPNKPNT